jgi:hypothetical protein
MCKNPDPEQIIAKVLKNTETASRIMLELSAIGYAIVPRTPTEAMVEAGNEVIGGINGSPPPPKLVYHAMVDAKPW